jgi:hypothetical protein
VVVMLMTVWLFDLLCDAPCAPKSDEAAPKVDYVSKMMTEEGGWNGREI